MNRLLLVLASTALLATACRNAGDKKEAKPELSPACAGYMQQASACIDSAEDKAKPAVSAVYAANKASIDKADTAAKMEALTKQCEKWAELLGKNPQCKK